MIELIAHVLNSAIFLFSFLAVLSLLVFIHELGHYSVARFFNISVDRFSIGFGKPIFKRRAKSGTEWVIGRIPLGGYVKFFGDAGAASNPDRKQLANIREKMEKQYGEGAWKTCFHFKPLYQRALVVLAGPLANFILAIFLFAVLAMAYGTYSSKAVVANVAPDGAAKEAGFLPGDEFLSINGKSANQIHDVQNIITLHSGDELDVVVLRDGKETLLKVTPKRAPGKDGVGGHYEGGKIGVGLASGQYEKVEYSPLSALGYGVSAVSDSLSGTLTYIGRMVRGKEDGKALGGIVKIAAITGKVGVDAVNSEGSAGEKAQNLLARLLSLAAILSVGLGFANLMPIPVLDGGHLLYYGYEAVMRRPLGEKAQEIGYRIGFAVLITLFLVLTWNDIGYVPSLFDNAG